jgi:hypothetical protein
MDDYRTRRFISVAVIAIIIVIAVFGLIRAANLLFFSSGNNSLTPATTHELDLLSTTANRAVRMSVRGPIVADENFHSYQIQITPNGRSLTVYAGYLNQTISNESLGNNVPAYEQFVYALDRAKFMDSDVFTGSNNDTRGVCATGYLYEFTILNDNKSIKQLWATSCSNLHGSFSANVDSVMNLFIVQIPDAQKVVGGIW